MVLLLLSASAADERPFGHDRCGGIPGGMYDQLQREDTEAGSILSVTMHRYTTDDANTHYLAAVFLDAAGRPIRRWRGEWSRSKYADATASWTTTALLDVPPGTLAAHLFDVHYDRRCVLMLAVAGDVSTIEVGLPGGKNPELLATITMPEIDETLDEAIQIKRSGKGRGVEKTLEDAPEDLEARAKKLAMLKRTLPQLNESQVLEWMGHQGMKPDDADVIEAIGSDWRRRARKSD